MAEGGRAPNPEGSPATGTARVAQRLGIGIFPSGELCKGTAKPRESCN